MICILKECVRLRTVIEPQLKEDDCYARVNMLIRDECLRCLNGKSEGVIQRASRGSIVALRLEPIKCR